MPANTLAKSSRKLYLDIARVLAILLVCLNHAVNRSYATYHDQMLEFESLNFLSTLFKSICFTASQFGVPLFLMISGKLILNKQFETPRDIKHFYKNNLLRIIITAEIWYILMYWFILLFDKDYAAERSAGIFSAIWGMVKTMLFLDQISFGSMWYIPMIICIYATIPFVAMIKDKLNNGEKTRLFLVPILLLYGYSMVLPTVNGLLRINGEPIISTTLYESFLFSYFYLYIFAGYWIDKGGLSRLRFSLVVIMLLLSYGLGCGMQLYAYSQPTDYVFNYSSALLPISASLLFEIIRRSAHRFSSHSKPITYVSKISFGIYFMHIVIMTVLASVTDTFDLYRPVRLIMYMTVSFAGSVVIIMPLSRIPLLRKHLFMIK